MRFLHLSDIHFAHRDGSPDTDLDDAVRERMLDDISHMHHRLGDMDAVLVVGDIAVRGKRTDYEVAASFLERVCKLVGLAEDQVVCVPGNHDIDRDRHDALHAAVRYQLRKIEPLKISGVLLQLLEEEDGRQLLLRPLEAYNRFALRYGCAIGHGSLVWKPKTLKLGARDVYLHGLNSAWVCDKNDSYVCSDKQVVAGLFQLASVASDPSVISVVLCHHPLRWLRDADLVQSWLARAQLVLTGHEHEAGIAMSDDKRSLRIASGAVNPNQNQAGWIPAYNVIDLTLIAADRLQVQIFSRTWQNSRAEFGPDQSTPQPYTCELRLDPSPMIRESPDIQLAVPSASELSLPANSTTVAPEPERFVSDKREMVYDIMSVSPDKRRNSARTLGLLDEEQELNGFELDKKLLRCALDSGQLEEFHRRIVNGR